VGDILIVKGSPEAVEKLRRLAGEEEEEEELSLDD